MNMKKVSAALVAQDSMVTLHYRLSGPVGDVVNTFEDKPATLSMGAGQLSPALEQCLLGLAEGSRQQFHVESGLAFGPRNPELVQWVSHDLLARMGDPLEDYHVGDVVSFPTPDGQGSYAGVVRDLRFSQGQALPSAILFDFNHPLAGQPVQFEVQIIGVI